MFEPTHAKLLPRREFIRRLGWSTVTGIGLITCSLALGIVGYHALCGLPWVDAFLEAAMILSGMGPTSPITGSAGKIFSGLYAIYCGIALIGTTGVIMAPIIHRGLHKFHLEDSDPKH